MESSRRKLPSNPRETTNILSNIFFTWTVPIFVKGYKKDLEMEDMYAPMTSDRSDNLGDRLEKAWHRQQATSSKPSLIVAVFKTFWREYLRISCMSAFLEIVLRLAQPLILGQLLQYFRKDSTMKYEDAMIYASGMVLLAGINAIMVNQFFIAGFHIGMKVRLAICSIIYRKALKLSHTALGETAPGKVVNLLSNDVNRFDLISLLINSMWTAPTLTIIVGILLWFEIGWAGVIGIAIVFIVVPVQSYTGKLSSIFRLKTALRTDERVRFMDEIISGVQVIKMYAWELPFAKLIALARKMELNVVRKSSYVRALYMTFMLFTTRMAIFCTMLSIVLLYGSEQITAAKVFVISAYFGIIAHTMSQIFVRGVAEIAEALVAFRRLQNFLELDEKVLGPDAVENGFKSENDFTVPENISVALRNLTARWELPATPNPLQNGKKASVKYEVDETDTAPRPATLDGLNAELESGKLIGVVGPVGAGKSSLLQAVLRELPIESGTIRINGTISYASQEPWVFAGSVRQNILFGQDYEKGRYDAVIRACALVTDFEQLPDGDRTIIGERGTSLSGGQKARVNLARATYRRSDIYLLDDPLSAVDSHVGAHIFNKCLGPKGCLAQMNSTRILVTHQVHFLKDADWIIMLQDGKIAAQGTPADLANSGLNLVTPDENDTDKRSKAEQLERQASRSMSRQSSVGSLSTHSIDSSRDQSVSGADDTDEKSEKLEGVQLEASSKGKVKGSKAAKYFGAGAHWFTLTLLLFSVLATQILASAADIWVSIWTKLEEQRSLQRKMNDSDDDLGNDTESTSISASLSSLIPLELSTEACMYVHGTIMALLFLIALSRSLGFYSICVRASQKLHDGMFKGLISTRMRFFDTNPSGRVLNRFSKDIGAIDEYLPKAILDATQLILNMIGAVIVTAYANPIFLVPVFLMSFLFVFIRRAFLKTSKSIKRLEGNAKSPVYTHLAATLNGLSTIRAYNAEAILKDEFDYHQDTHTSSWFMFISTASAFGFSLDVMCFVYVFCIVYFYMIFDNNASGDQIGLAITQAMTLTGMLQWGVRQSAEVSNQLMAVERVLEYRNLEPEPEPAKPRAVDKEWPANGSIEFKNVIYRYFAEAEPVLRGLSFVIKPKEKIGIVGRTGAGKSSLIGAIFRMASMEGEISIDGVDTSTLSLEKLRSSVAIIPQDPVLFSGTLRRNLDPFEEYHDADLWNALEKVELKDVASGPAGLHSPVLARGSNFSVGQRQLICLARAILRKNRVLVLDEATANVDPKTDLLIQETIREKFAECTVLTIAHRLHTIIDSDRILVMDAGQAVEFDEAHRLLKMDTGIFSGMVKTLGPQEHRRLVQTALEKHNSNRKVSTQQSYL